MSTDLGAPGAGGELSSSANGAEGAPPNGSGEAAQDYIEKVRTDPDFAEREVRNLKSRFNTSESTLNKLNASLGKAKEVFESGQISGDEAVRDAQAWRQLFSDPAMTQIVTQFVQTGKAPEFGQAQTAAATESDEEFMTDTEKRLTGEVTELKGMLEKALQRIGHTESSYGMTAMQTDISAIGSEIGMTEEIFDRVKTEVGQELDRLSANSQRGDAQAQHTFQMLTGPERRTHLERLVKSRLAREDWEKIVAHHTSARQRGLDSLSTGSPGIAVAPAEVLDPASFKGDWRAALEQARLDPNRNQSR